MFRSAACLRFFRNRRNREVHLPFEDIDARDKNQQLITNAESLAGSPPKELSPSGLKQIKVVCERGNMDQSGEESIGQFDHQSVIPDIDNCR